MQKKIKVSVAVSVYNHGISFLEKCLKSLHEQKLKDDIEFIVVDNGATDDSKKLLAEYEEKDSRFKIIHFAENRGYAKALNEAIAQARGEYIAIVESDDFVTPDIYEKMYAQITKFDADVCIAGFYIYNNGKSNAEHIHNQEIFSHISEKKLFSISDYPYLLTCHQSIWAKLYKASFVKQIPFCEKGRYIDAEFMIDVFCKTKKLIGLKLPVLYYRDDNPNASSTNLRRDASLMQIVDDFHVARQTLKDHQLYDLLKHELYFQSLKAGYRFYKNILPKYRKKFFQKWVEFLKDLQNDTTYKFTYLDEERKNFVEAALRNDYKASLRYIHKRPRYKKFIEWVFSVKNSEDRRHKVVCVLGLKIKVSRTFSTRQEVIALRKDLVRELATLREFVYQANYMPLKVASVHQQVFPQFHNIHNQDEVVVVGCGPSLHYYSPFEKAKHISLNRAIRHKDIRFDYAFIWDLPATQKEEPEFMEEFLQYDCIKFVGQFLHDRCNVPMDLNFPYKNKMYRCFSASRAGFPIGMCDPVIHQDISVFPLADFMSIAFGALNFAAYTHPKKIYLVGLDTKQTACFDGREHQYYMKELMLGYRLFKEFFQKYYSDVEVISVNPVGLKGMFKDMYTQAYVDAHPELLEEDIEILKD